MVSVPRGGSAAFLAPRPLSLLAITPEVQHMLEALGVRTLGEFAALPAPSVSRPLESDYQALARGDSGCALRPYAPDAPIREQLAVASGDSLFGASAAVATLAERLALRLSGRGRGAARLELRISGEQGERAVALSGPSAAFTAEELAGLLLPQIGEAPGQVTRLGVVVAGEAIAGVEAVPAALEAAIGTAATGPIAAGGAAGQVHRGEDSVIDALSAALSVSRGGSTRPRPDRAERADREDGRSLPWQLSAAPTLRAERRDAHRRTRRARRRRIATPAQPLLFGHADG